MLALGLAVSAAFLLAAVIVGTASTVGGGATWAAVHLALAGAATTAIGTFMPHFAITLAGTRPEPPAQRLAGLALLAGGGAAAVAGIALLGGPWAGLGAVAMVAGLAFVAWQTAAPLRNPLARRHPIVTATYLVALGQLALGVTIGGLAASGVDAVTGAWGGLRPAHAWLTLFGAVSLTIFGTLVYLAPTVLGARIRAGAGLAVGAVGMLGGPVLAAAGFAAASGPAAVAGVALTAAGALGQIAYVVDAVRRRGPYTSEHDWRRVAVWHLAGGTGWFAIATIVALVELLGGRPVVGWTIGPLAIPLVAGWMVQELIGSWTHLVPSVTPGDPEQHARQRRVLSVASRLRPIGWNLGIALAWPGVALDLAPVAGIGAALLAVTALTSILLLGRALTIGRY